jgi:hypothetical protein
MISEKLVVKHAPRVIGEQIHINHEGCEAGEDTKRRLYIKRVEKGVVAFCHNCQEKRFVRDSLSKTDRLSRVFHKPDTSMPVLPRNISSEIVDTIPPSGQMWLHKYGFHYVDTCFKGIRGKEEQLALRLLDTSGDTIGWQVRNLDGKPPKYVTRFSVTDRGNNSWFTQISNTLVITEDYLSAYKVFKHTRFSSMALLTTSLSDNTLKSILDSNYTIIKIWLDPDEAGRQGTIKVLNKLSYFLPEGTKLQTILQDKEAKQSTAEEIRETLR